MKMAQTRVIGRRGKGIVMEDGVLRVSYWNTYVVTWDKKTNTVTLNSNGWHTLTTKTRMNQTSNQYGLGFYVFQKNFIWYVELPNGETVEYEDHMTFKAAA
jgi:hypothetical protein